MFNRESPPDCLRMAATIAAIQRQSGGSAAIGSDERQYLVESSTDMQRGSGSAGRRAMSLLCALSRPGFENPFSRRSNAILHTRFTWHTQIAPLSTR